MKKCRTFSSDQLPLGFRYFRSIFLIFYSVASVSSVEIFFFAAN